MAAACIQGRHPQRDICESACMQDNADNVAGIHELHVSAGHGLKQTHVLAIL